MRPHCSHLLVALLLALVLPLPICNGAEIAEGTEGFDARIKPFFQTYCYDCHGPDTAEDEMTLTTLAGDMATGENVERWEVVLERIGSGEMPPEDMPQPKAEERQAVTKWIESGMKRYIAREGSAPKIATTRRLTNFEYQNTLNVLLGFELDVLDELPEDPERFYHFNNTADLMRIGPEQLDRYLEIARYAMDSAIVNPNEKPEVFRHSREWSSIGNYKGMAWDELGIRGNSRHTVGQGTNFRNPPLHGEYRLRIRAAAILPPGYEETPLQLQMGTARGRTETPYKNVGTLYLKNSPDEPQVYEFRGRIENHPFTTSRDQRSGQTVREMSLRPEVIFDDGTLNDADISVRALGLPRAMINWIELEVPVVDVWPPAHHTAILFDSPLKETNPSSYMREVLQRFMSQAYRRPATEEEIDRFVRIYEIVRPSVESFEEAARETLAMVLISPQFLFHSEADPTTDEHYAMASRLSYFLWANMPDAELMQLAAQRKLNDPSVIEQQVLRMLADDRSQSFVEDFTLQWLSIRKMLTVPINIELFPRFLDTVKRGETSGTEVPYRPSVRDYMMQETIGFVGELIRRNESVLAVVDSDFAYLNERLAVHYGVEGVKGERLRPVPLKPKHRLGGLLTHGSILIGNGTGTAPHPIYRAVWLREAILGDEVPPPPSEVPALSDTAGESLEQAVSIAELLARHRTEKSCNNCHAGLDPWGIPFEQYNAIGRFQPKVPENGTRVSGFDANRHKDLAGYKEYLDSINSVEVDASARVPGGPEITGVDELKAFLLEHRSDDVIENVVRRLLSYSLGRDLTFHDRFAVEQMCEQAKSKDAGMRDIIVDICKSDLFRDSITQKNTSKNSKQEE